jgi:ABC-type lipoprotein export system ATPase subunit
MITRRRTIERPPHPDADRGGSATLVSAFGVGRNYGRGRRSVPALIDASFEIARGDRVAVVGPSGSGKSTLLDVVAGIEPPTSGTIEWPGLGPPNSLRPGPIAVAFQSAGLLPALTVLENVELPGLLMGWDEARAKESAMSACRRFEVDGVSGKLPEEISGGQAQRAGMARAVGAEPTLLLADEPTGQQDRASAGRVVDALLEWAAGAEAAVVVATHDPAIAERFPIRWELLGGRLASGVVARSR